MYIVGSPLNQLTPTVPATVTRVKLGAPNRLIWSYRTIGQLIMVQYHARCLSVGRPWQWRPISTWEGGAHFLHHSPPPWNQWLAASEPSITWRAPATWCVGFHYNSDNAQIVLIGPMQRSVNLSVAGGGVGTWRFSQPCDWSEMSFQITRSPLGNWQILQHLDGDTALLPPFSPSAPLFLFRGTCVHASDRSLEPNRLTDSARRFGEGEKS